MFQHEDVGRQLVWALQRYVQVDIQGPEQSCFEEETNRNMSKLKGWTLLSSLLKLWMDENASQQSNKNC